MTQLAAATLDHAVMYDNKGGFPFVSRTDATETDVVAAGLQRRWVDSDEGLDGADVE